MIRNHPGAYGLFAALLVLLLGAIVNASCCGVKPPNSLEQYEETLTKRTPAQQARFAVSVHTECGAGSGVLVSGTTVITARHVVDCNGTPAHYIAVHTADGKSRIAYTEIDDAERDLARLKLTTAVDGVTPVHIRFAVTGERVCTATATPERARHCGAAGGFGGKREHGDLEIGASVWYGNSGSGVYSSDGALIGIAVRLSWCDQGDALFYMLTGTRVDTCGGRVSSINDSTVLP